MGSLRYPRSVRRQRGPLSNHDSPRVVTRLGDGPEGLARARALALIAHALPGSVYVYQGEELGLCDVEVPDSARQDPVWFRSAGREKGRDGGRVPLPWSGSQPPYGFTDRADVSLWLPPTRALGVVDGGGPRGQPPTAC